MARYLIGIDLGTTNSAMAYVDLQHPRRGERLDIKSFSIPQLTAAGEVKERPLLPSFLYLPGRHDLPPGATALPWDAQRNYAVGEFAHNHGGKVPGRLVSSAKSWLCHGGVDRSAGVLPWAAPPDVPRVSPIEASARYLRHMVESWNYVMAEDRPDERLEKQTVVLTVPASFDDMARNLTVDAARKAGLEDLILLEEPQAAFYCWQATHSAKEAASLKPGMRCLVVDVGGGTSDFSLIEAVEQQGELGFVRQAVGDHLLLGGDNMDLALAKFVETKLPAAGRLDVVQYGVLTQACRLAKETLLSPNAPPQHTVTVIGRGRAVIGGTLHAPLTPDDVRKVILDGFFPLVPVDALPQRGARAGLHEMGLPYVSDPAITRHLADFLRNRLIGSRNDESVPPVSALLFNGGVFQPAVLRERVVEVLRQWYERPGQPWQPLVLTNPSLDLAVAWGAAYYAWLRHTGGRRIGGGIARSYYIGVQQAQRAGSVSDGQTLTVVCVVPQHMEEGQDIVLDKPELELSLGQPVLFPLYTSTVRSEDKAGDLLMVSPEQLLRMPPLHTVLRGGKRSGTKSVPVTLAARSTAIGTLELFCVARDGHNRWRLEFNVRDLVQETPLEQPNRDSKGAETPGEQTVSDVWPEAQVQEAARLIRAVYGAEPSDQGVADSLRESGKHSRSECSTKDLTPQELTKALEAALDAPRHAWPTGLCRRLWEFLAEGAEGRRRSPSHLSRWYNLAGYCLRPGFGDPLDKYRIEQLWKMMAAPPRPPLSPPVPGGDRGGKGTRGTAPRPPLLPPRSGGGEGGGADAWIMWRRVAGGLHSTLQQSLYDRLRPVLLPAKGKVIAKPGANELAEMWRAAAAFERLDVKHKEALGNALLKSLRRSPAPTYGFWALTRLGARSLLYGPLNAIVHHQVAEKWLETIQQFEPGNQSERLAWAFCLSQLARRTGQRALDIDDSHRENVVRVLRNQSVPAHWVRMVEEVSELEQEEQGQMLGDSLPIGLRLLQPEE